MGVVGRCVPAVQPEVRGWASRSLPAAQPEVRGWASRSLPAAKPEVRECNVSSSSFSRRISA
jgi:hypothetical protein